MKTYLVRGVPTRMQQDGWWLNPSPPAASSDKGARASGPVSLALLVAMIALADVLFWDRTPALSLAMFGAVCFGVALTLWPRPITPRTKALSTGIMVLSVLPVVELVQPLSLLFFFGGLPVSVALLAGRRPRGSLRYWWAAPIFSCLTAMEAAPKLVPSNGFGEALNRIALAWGLPIGVGLVFAMLLLSANPVLESWALSVPRLNATLPAPERPLLWLVFALLVWPVLKLPQFARVLSPDVQSKRAAPAALPSFVNGPAIVRSLVLFNLLFALQNGMDFAVLAGGAALPDGMSYAQYAHRGAYPLVVLALLSGGFALLARPFITQAPVLRALLLIWVAQTIWLTCSSLLRLDLYVETYGLTRLRLSAAIWMGLVATGLGLTLWQIGREHSNGWLLYRAGVLGIAVLYLCSFVSFDRIIARYNLTHEVRADAWYLCSLSEAVIPEIARLSGKPLSRFCASRLPHMSTPQDFREWGFRNARLRRSLAQIQSSHSPHE